MYDFAIEGRPPLLRSQSPTTIIYSVTPDFFRAANIPLLRGRMFTAYDNNAKAPPVALINETLAKQQFPNEDPIGKRISVGVGNDARPWREIVGVVADFKEDGLDRETRCQYYAPYAQYPFGFTILVGHSGNPAAVHAALKEQVYALDRDQPVANIQKLAAFVNDSMWRERLTMQSLVAFSMLALVIAAVGIYGVIAYTVSQRTAEIGIRMALGATQTDVLGHVLREGMTVVAIGLALGVAATLGMGQLVQTLLFKTSAHDPVVLAGIMVVIAAVALVACLVPARRAVKVDPVVALRAE
jgi:putative ABC transport system permease protein